MATMPRPRDARVGLILGVAVIAVSLAAIFVRLAAAPGVVVAAYRMVLASLLLAPCTVRALRRTPFRGRALWFTLLAGLLLAGHFATWITSLSYTSVTAAVTLVNTIPLWVALLSWLLLGAAPTLTVLLGALLAVAGGAVIGFGDLGGGSAPLLGDGLALAGAIFVSGYLLLGRQVQRSGVTLQAYVGVAYGVAALALLPLPLLLGQHYGGYSGETLLWIALLALVPQLIGHTGINHAMKHLDPTLVSTVVLLEPLGATLLALLVFAEVPATLTLLGAGVLLFGVLLTVRSGRRERVTEEPETAGEQPTPSDVTP
jgi:drug/metabolite transporter (DMT)-like permease